MRDSLHSSLLLFNCVCSREGGRRGGGGEHTHPKKRVFDFQGLPITHALHTGNQVKLLFCFPNLFHGIMNIICPEETPSEIDAALPEMLENTFPPLSFSSPNHIFLKNLSGCHVAFYQMAQRHAKSLFSSDNLRWMQVILIGEEVSGVSGQSKTLESPRDDTTPLQFFGSLNSAGKTDARADVRRPNIIQVIWMKCCWCNMLAVNACSV